MIACAPMIMMLSSFIGTAESSTPPPRDRALTGEREGSRWGGRLDGTTTSPQDPVRRPPAPRRAHPRLRPAPLGRIGAPGRVPFLHVRLLQPRGGRARLLHRARPLPPRRRRERRPHLFTAVAP